jgi:hypothetical protein
MVLQRGSNVMVSKEDAAVQNEIELKRGAAKAEADKFDLTFTAKQKQKQAEAANAHKEVDSSQAFTPEDKLEAHKRIDYKYAADYEPTRIPQDPSAFKWPEGQGYGIPWVDKTTGALVTGKKDRDGTPYVSLLVRPDQMTSYDEKKTIATTLTKQADKVFDARIKLLTTPYDGVDKYGEAVKKYRTSAEVDEILKSAPGAGDAPKAAPAGAAPAGAPAPSGEWWDSPAAQSMGVQDSDKRFPQEVGYARAFVRSMKGSVPEDQRDNYLEAVAILKKYQESR